MMASRKTFTLGLIGHPLGHSISPKIHSAALNACGLQGDYSLFPIAPDDLQGLSDLLMRVRHGEVHGLNVTIPHKQNVIPLLDESTPTAQAIGAVNTISMRDGNLVGDNTDAPGFLADLQNFLTTETRRHGEKKALVLGAGGSARAIVYALVHAGWDVILSARRPEQAQALASNYQLPITTDLRLATFDLLVNTTPLGMTPNVDASPWPTDIPFPPNAAVYDLVYNPRETKLVRDARAQGLPAATGLGMLIEQAALAFEMWMGRRPPREVLFQQVVE